jgi:hypothetical protein
MATSNSRSRRRSASAASRRTEDPSNAGASNLAKLAARLQSYNDPTTIGEDLDGAVNGTMDGVFDGGVDGQFSDGWLAGWADLVFDSPAVALAEVSDEQKKALRRMRNRIAARESRLRKKVTIVQLQQRLDALVDVDLQLEEQLTAVQAQNACLKADLSHVQPLGQRERVKRDRGATGNGVIVGADAIMDDTR